MITDYENPNDYDFCNESNGRNALECFMIVFDCSDFIRISLLKKCLVRIKNLGIKIIAFFVPPSETIND